MTSWRRRDDLGVAIVSLLTSAGSALLLGWRHGGDSTRYLGGAMRLLAGEPFIEKESSYIGYVALVAAIKGVGLSEQFLHLAQILTACVACVASARLCLALGGGRFGAWVAVALIALNPDIVRWQHYLLTDSLYTSMLLITLYAAHMGRTSRRWAIMAAVAAVASASVRPNGWLLIAVLVVLLIHREFKAQRRDRLGRWAVVASVVTMIVVVGANGHARRMVDRESPARWLREGRVIWGTEVWDVRMPSNRSPVAENWVDGLSYVVEHPIASTRLFAARIGAELVHARPFYSTRHNALILLLLPFYFLVVLGFRRARERPLAHLLAVVITLHLALVGLTFADWDGRFLVALLPAMSVLAGAGSAALLARGDEGTTSRGRMRGAGHVEVL